MQRPFFSLCFTFRRFILRNVFLVVDSGCSFWALAVDSDQGMSVLAGGSPGSSQ